MMNFFGILLDREANSYIPQNPLQETTPIVHGVLGPNQLARMCCYMGLQFQMKEYEIKRKINEYIYLS